MKAAFYLCRNREHGNRIVRLAYNAYPGEKILSNLGEFVSDADLHVTWGIFKEFNQMTQPIRDIEHCGKPHVVLEMGYVRRGWDDDAYYSFGVGGLNGYADHFNDNSPDDRRRDLNVNLEPYHVGDRTIVCGQVTRDASVQHHDHAQWIREILQQYPDSLYREHPLQGHPVSGVGAEKCTCPNISIARKHNIHKLITFNSNAGVEATILGIPVIAMDKGSMVWGLVSENPDAIMLPDREQWFNNLTYAQWKPSEFEQRWKIILPRLSTPSKYGKTTR